VGSKTTPEDVPTDFGLMVIGSFPKTASAANLAPRSLDKPNAASTESPAFRGERQPIRSHHNRNSD